VVSVLAAGLGCRCPRCGRGRLYSGLLTVVPSCADCGLDLRAHDTGDGPAVFVVFALGAVVVPLAIGVEVWFAPPFWVHLLVWTPVIVALAIALLRPMKAIMVALHYKNLGHEYEGGR
jgi:uncharacterized protein (DUF983 family)